MSAKTLALPSPCRPRRGLPGRVSRRCPGPRRHRRVWPLLPPLEISPSGAGSREIESTVRHGQSDCHWLVLRAGEEMLVTAIGDGGLALHLFNARHELVA